jgi:16S rRNA (cytosine1402-N4)-methyltransferase
VKARHEPVLVDEVLRFLRAGPGLYLDATLGDAGHAEALLRAEPGARLLGADRDLEALAFARQRLAPFGARVITAHATFRELPDVWAGVGRAEPLGGALLDLGLSSRQIDDPTRGMSFMSEGPLDLRMDRSRGVTAAERLAAASEDEILAVLVEHGDLSMGARRLARALSTAARSGELSTTRALVRLMERVFGGRPHPRRLAQVFQALRIWVNGEAEDLETLLQWLPGALRPEGVVVTLAYHSGEDRRIKRAVRGASRAVPRVRNRRFRAGPAPSSPDPFAPPERGAGPWQELTRKVVTPSHDEKVRNPRSRSARLRAFRRTSE